ncbi:MAG: ankyrin repeat domain-containing protein [Myxococcales bacterium]|jgi:hypothetical protein
MTGTARQGQSKQVALRALFEAIAARAHGEAARWLAQSPELATLALEVGATRAEASHNYFEGIAHYAYAGDTPLHFAAAAYELGIVEQLLAKGASVNAKNRRGAQPLHYAADGSPGSLGWKPEAQFAVIERLIRAGADPNALDKSGVAPLHRAVRTRCASAVRALLEHGAHPELENKSGSTALDLAQRTTGRGGSGSPAAREQQAEIIQLLSQAR